MPPKKRSQAVTQTGETIQENDDVLVAAHEDQPHFEAYEIEKPFIARVRKVYKGPKSGLVSVKWYYRPEDPLTGGRKPFHGQQELFSSDHEQDLEIETVICKCRVMDLNAYLDLPTEPTHLDYYTRFHFNPQTKKFTPGRVPVFCRCEMPYNPDKFMVTCCTCTEQYHPECLDPGAVSREADLEELALWQCPFCAARGYCMQQQQTVQHLQQDMQHQDEKQQQEKQQNSYSPEEPDGGDGHGRSMQQQQQQQPVLPQQQGSAVQPVQEVGTTQPHDFVPEQDDQLQAQQQHHQQHGSGAGLSNGGVQPVATLQRQQQLSNDTQDQLQQQNQQQSRLDQTLAAGMPRTQLQSQQLAAQGNRSPALHLQQQQQQQQHSRFRQLQLAQQKLHRAKPLQDTIKGLAVEQMQARADAEQQQHFDQQCYGASQQGANAVGQQGLSADRGQLKEQRQQQGLALPGGSMKPPPLLSEQQVLLGAPTQHQKQPVLVQGSPTLQQQQQEPAQVGICTPQRQDRDDDDDAKLLATLVVSP